MAVSRTADMLSTLRAEKVDTWFELGLLMDRLREDREVPGRRDAGDLAAFKREIAQGIAFLTFEYGVDGVSMEIAKYAHAFQILLPSARIHYIAGKFAEHADAVIDRGSAWHRVEAMDGFDRWPLYRDFFSRKLERGGPLYNELIQHFWAAALELCQRLGEIVEKNDIRLLFLANTNSNPGNVALALAAVLVSEHLRIPVINNCHDFYWEGGHSEVEREVRDIPPGPRDHFFTNAHVGEVFSVVEMLYPWESRSWIALCINHNQVSALSERFGISPGNLSEIGTAIDIDRFSVLDRRRTKEAWNQMAEIFKGPRARLQALAAADVIEEGGLGVESRVPLLLARRGQAQVDFASNNTVLLQPTRILARKKIGMAFRLIHRLFQDEEWVETFRSDRSKKLTLLVTGPVATGHSGYLKRLVRKFVELTETVDPTVRDRVYLALLFSAFDSPTFRQRHEQPLGMPELYNIASLVVLPSETEGRGLPIIESAACGVPIFTRRYAPEDVFAAVVGESLAPQDRLEVNAFTGSRLSDATVARVKETLLSSDRLGEVRRHNRRVVERRFSMQVLTADLEAALHRLYLQLQPAKSAVNRARAALRSFALRVSRGGPELAALLGAEQREYLPGFGRMGFMLMLKSLIDPSYFRVEEQRLRGIAFCFARQLMDSAACSESVALAQELEFYKRVDSLFLCRQGEMPIRIDHSFAYRHRNRRHYHFRNLTPQELTGVIVLLHRGMFGRAPTPRVRQASSHHVADWHSMVARCCGGELTIDDRDRLRRRLGENVPIAIFPGLLTEHELDVFVLQAARLRLGLGIQDELTEDHWQAMDTLAPITIIERRDALPEGMDAEALEKYLASGTGPELELLYRRGICRVIRSEQLSLGIDFRQIGRPALRALAGVRDAGGFVIALCEQAAMTTDGVRLERFHIGRAADPFTANIMGIPEGSGYVQWAPAGLRSTLAYPTPIQTAKGLSKTFRGRRFRSLCKQLGEDIVLEALREDAEQCGSSVEAVLERLVRPKRVQGGAVAHESLNGLYADGAPWSGVIAMVSSQKRSLRYVILSSDRGSRTVPEFVHHFNHLPRRQAQIAWNGGYILNAELVGKLGLPESYIGSQLGLIISGGRVLSPPLFNKPAFLVGEDGSLSIRRVSCAGGLRVQGRRTGVEFAPESRNLEVPPETPCFYDLLYRGQTLPGDGRTIVRLVGNRIMELLPARPGEPIPVLPVGLVLSFPAGALPSDWKKGDVLSVEIAGLAGIAEAVEAGPALLENGEICIDMELEGWLTQNSILTQAARLDFLDMRGPKIAIGLDGYGNLAVLVVNGRIRESVGATHRDMAEIVKARGLESAMGFDPGGSATVVAGTETLNISPYSRDYERNVYSLAPQPRAVANAVIGY